MLIVTGLLLGTTIVLCGAAAKSGIPAAAVSFWEVLRSRG